jgi:hypothetical protein
LTNVRRTTSLRRALGSQTKGRERSVRPVPFPLLLASFQIRALNSRNSLLLKIISLLRFSGFPVLLLREFRRKCPSQKGFPQHEWAPSKPEFVIFPVFFPVTREFKDGDRFDSDCVRHQSVAAPQRFPGGGAKYPRIGAFPPGRPGLWILALCLHRRYCRSVSAPQNHFSRETETDLTRDRFEGGHHSVRSGLSDPGPNHRGASHGGDRPQRD